MDRIGKVYFKEVYAGELKEEAQGFCFTYASDFLVQGPPLSSGVSIFNRKRAFLSKRVFRIKTRKYGNRENNEFRNLPGKLRGKSGEGGPFRGKSG